MLGGPSSLGRREGGCHLSYASAEMAHTTCQRPPHFPGLGSLLLPQALESSQARALRVPAESAEQPAPAVTLAAPEASLSQEGQWPLLHCAEVPGCGAETPAPCIPV